MPVQIWPSTGMNNTVFHIVGTLFTALDRMVVFSTLFFQHSGEKFSRTRDCREVDTRPAGIGRVEAGVPRHYSVSKRHGKNPFDVYTGTGAWFVTEDFFRIKE